MTTIESGLCMGCMQSIGTQGVCPHCGYENNHAYDRNYKRPGSVVGGRYIVGRLERKNGEGATYIGYDNNTKQRVWIREYFPFPLAQRDLFTSDIHPAPEREAQYKTLLSDFADVCNQQLRLAATDSIIPIENALQENNTIYAIFRYMDVVPLETYLTRRGGRIPLSEARQMLMPLCNTLSVLHGQGELHRGISPYTVYVDANNKLYLWDFSLSAVRTANSELTTELFNGYSAPEQYSPSGWQGEWTDVYAVAALFYRMVSGFVPPKSTLIGVSRPLSPLSDLADVPQNVSDTVMQAMQTSTQERTQNMAAFSSKLMDSPFSNTAVFDSSKIQRAQPVSRKEEPPEAAEKSSGGKYVVLGLIITVILLLSFLWIFMSTKYPELMGKKNDSSPSSVQEAIPPESLAEEPLGEGTPQEEDSKEEEADKKVPGFVGKTVEEVTSNPQYLERFTFSIQEEFSDEHPKGMIYEQSPVEGTVMLNKGTIILYVSKGKNVVKMPDVLGKQLDEAMEILGKENIAYTEFERVVPGAVPGQVVSTTPAPGEEFNLDEDSVYVFYMPDETIPVADDVAEASSRMTVEEFKEKQRDKDNR